MRKSVLFLSLLLLSSCSQKTSAVDSREQKIPLFHYEEVTAKKNDREEVLLYRLTSSSYQHLMDQKVSFFCYLWAEGCSVCDAFGYTIKDLVREDQVLFPFLTLSEYETTASSLNFSESTLVFVSDGKVIDYLSDFSGIGSRKDLKNLLSDYTYDTGCTLFNEKSLDFTYPSFPTYSFVSRIREGMSYQEQESYLFVDETKKVDYPSLFQYLRKNSIGHLGFVGEELSQGISSIPAPGTYNLMTIEKGEKIVSSFENI